VNLKKKSERHTDHLRVIRQIEQTEAELTRQVTDARKAAEDLILQAQMDASTCIQLEQESARQARREMVRTEMEEAEFNATRELKEAEKKPRII